MLYDIEIIVSTANKIWTDFDGFFTSIPSCNNVIMVTLFWRPVTCDNWLPLITTNRTVWLVLHQLTSENFEVPR